MKSSQEKFEFIDKRKKLIRLWPPIGIGLVASVCILAAWLYFRTPMLIDPFKTIERLSVGSIPDTTLTIMAGMLPLMFLTSIGLMIMLILFVTVMLHNEKKYISIIENLMGRQ